MTAFQAYARCRWEGRWLPVDHVCVGDAHVDCEARDDDGRVCGVCTGCIAAAEAHLKQLDADDTA